ncbi:C25 family cysteine peptidase [Wenzhouxiangella marina]|uniref:C25 family cysteine peptidase n=1 Tax=Wenzhouxiangella marina TaxID=1579979 RepID=UPI0014706CAC|nr:C25 family cysteine peptidase [Wenzhouxiangella marina]MBB6086915.1 subtilisin-like proprotein convertase family protein [Wenzhouxiangella marina]
MTFNVSGISGSLTDVSLSITLAHTWLGDLDVVLAPPGVTPGNPGSLVIFSRVGAVNAGDAGDSSDLGASYVFSDAAVGDFWTAAGGVGGGDTVPAGSYRTSVAGPTTNPAASTSLIAAFGGLTPAQINGTWTLRFRDGWNADSGSVSAASLTLSDALIPPTITSANATTFTELLPGSFNVTAAGSLPITYSVSGSLPIGVSFDGATGVFSGVPALGSAGSYPLLITASNGTAPDDSQAFTLNVDPAAGGTLLSGGLLRSYESTTSLAIPDNGCPSLVTRTFNVSDSFFVGGFGTISLGLQIQHPNRSQLQISLQAPNGAVQVLQSGSGGALANINAMYTANADAGNIVNDGDADPLSVAGGTIPYRRLISVPGLDSFYSGSANGTWTLRICDSAAGSTGTLQRARLLLVDTGASVPQVCSSNSTFDWGSNGDGAVFASTVVAPDGVTLSQVSTSGEAPADGGSGVPSFTTRTGTQGNHTGFYSLTMDTSGDTELTAESVLFGFDRPVSGLSFSLLDVDKGGGSTTWEDYVRVTGVGPDGNDVPVLVSLDNTSNLSFAGDWVETDASSAPTETLGNILYRFASAVTQVRVQYAQGNEPNTDSVFQIIGISDFSFCADDYGDAPLSYCDGVTGSCPRHGLQDRDRLFIGSAGPDGETAPIFSAGATGDDSTLSADEVGSVSFPPPRLPNQGWVCGAYTTDPATNAYCITTSVTNLSGQPAQLVAWIDFNNNGVFDPGERSLPELQSMASTGFNDGNIPDGSTGFQAVLVFNPAAPIPNNSTPSMLRLRLSTDPIFFSDATPPSHLGAATNGEVEDHSIPVNTLPVTLAGFSAERISPEEILVRWSVATEAGTVGYRLLQQHGARGLHSVSGSTIPAHAGSSIDAQHYERVIRSDRNEPIYLEELAAGGRVERFGPFALGQSFGEELVYSTPPWAVARSEIRQAELQRQQSLRNRSSGAGSDYVDVLVSDTGVQKVALEDLHALGLDLLGRNPALIRLELDGEEVPLHIDGDGSLSAGNDLLFLGQALEGSQYSRVRPYRLSLAGGQRRWSTADATPVSGPVTERIRHRFALDEDRFYNFSSPTADPWYFDTIRRVGASVGKTWSLDLPGPIEGVSDLTIELWGGLDYPGGDPDHRLQVSVNGVRLGEHRFDGIRDERLRFNLGDELLHAGSNEIRIDLLETGHPADVIRVESIEVGVSVPIDASIAAEGFSTGKLQFRFDGISLRSFEAQSTSAGCGTACEQLKIVDLEVSDLLAIQTRGEEVMQLLDPAIESDGRGGFVATMRTGSLLANEDDRGSLPDRVFVIPAEQAHRPELRLAALTGHPIEGGAAELIAIATTRFMDGIEPLLETRRAEGLSARAVDVEQIYAHYSGGIVDPNAIRDFLRDAHDQLGTRYVLLVGGDTYDYLGRLQNGSVSDVPTFYGQVHEVVRFAPLDHRFADLDGDELPELALGRLPVRTQAELDAAVARILDHETDLEPSMLFAAERMNAAESSDYGADADFIISQMVPSWQQDVERLYLDDFPTGPGGVAAARGAMMSALNRGSRMVAYFGHGAPTLWSREQLLQSNQVGSVVANASMSPIVTEFGCWGGYFVAPEFNTMSHAWMNSGPRGAVAVLSSSGLTEHASDLHMALALLPRLQQPGARLGDALREAKIELASQAPEYLDIVRAMTLFGDPSMPVSQ